MTSLYGLTRPALFALDPERAHDAAIAALAKVSRSGALCAAVQRRFHFDDPRLAVDLFGRRFSSPIGVAAGFDKNGVAVQALLALGFACVEVGTVTPLPQPGSAKPRVFRLLEDQALINRMGFPGRGMREIRDNLARIGGAELPIGCNIGPNKTSVEAGTAANDFTSACELLHDLAAYLVVNVSSPNTAKLRDLQTKSALRDLLHAVLAARPAGSNTPLLVKISPDLPEAELDAVLETVIDLGLGGIVATNTTTTRPATLRGAARMEAGGLSGRPLRQRSLAAVRRISEATDGRLPILAAGGIFTGADALAAIAAGASLVQIYTGFIYRGPAAARSIKREMSELLDRWGVRTLEEIRGDREIAALAAIATSR